MKHIFIEDEYLYMDNDLKLRNFKLREIIEEEAKSLLNYILKSADKGVVYNEGSKKAGSILSYMPFIACKSNEDWAEIMHELDLIKHIYGNGPPVEINVKWTKKKMYKKAHDPIDKLIKMTGFEYEIELPRRHVIIITHKDADGFYSALQIYKKHYNEKRTKITVVPIMPVQLVHELRKVPWKYFGVEKLVYILDIAINMSEKKALDDIFRKYSENKNRIESVWIDHHTLEYSRNKLELDWDIKVINISQENFTCGMLVYNYIEGLRLNIRHYNFAVKLGLKLGVDLSYWKTIFIDNMFKPKYPTKFFERVILRKRNKVYNSWYKKAVEQGVNCSRMDVYKTGDGLDFAVMVLENNPSTRKILRYLKEYGPEDRVLEFAVIRRTSMNYSIYKLGVRDLRFDVLKEEVIIRGGHMTEVISIPAIGLIVKKVENVVFRKRLYLDELISILEGKELEIKDFNKRLGKLKSFSMGLGNIIEYFRTFGVEDTKPIRDNNIRKYIELYKFYRIFKDMIKEYNYPDPNLLMKLVFKKNITIDTIKMCIETGDIEVLKNSIYDITGEEYMDEDTETLILNIFWGVWKHYPDIRIVNDIFIKEYSKLEGVPVELLIYLKIFRKVKLYMLYDYKFMKTDFEDENSVSKLVNEFINTYLNDFIAGYEVVYKYDLIKKESDKLIMEKIRQKEGAEEYFGKFVKKVKEVYDRLYGGGRWEYGGEIREKEKVPTHIEALDGILGGGLEIGSVYELQFGDPWVIDDLVHYLMVSLQLRRKENGTYLKVRGKSKILVLETGRYVGPRKLGRVVKAFRRDIQMLVSNVVVAEIRDIRELEKMVLKIGEIIEELQPIAVIINRLTDIAFKEVPGKYSGEDRREYYIERNKIINNIIKKLGEARAEFGFTTIIINKMKDDALVNYTISDKIKYLHVIMVEKMGTKYKKGSKIIKVEYKGSTSVRPRSVYIEKVGGKYKEAEMNEIRGKEILV